MRAAAAEAPPVHLDLGECARLDAASVRRIFAADLGTKATSEASPDVTEVTISCEGVRVLVKVRDPLSRKTVRRSFDSTTFGDRGESRLVAIAASELVLASWAELASNREPTVAAEGPPPRADTLATARAVVRARDSARANPPPGGAPIRNLDSDASARAQPANPPGLSTANRAGAGSLVMRDEDGADPTDDSAPPKERKLSTNGAGPHPVVRRVLAVLSQRTFLDVDGGLAGGGARYGEDRENVVSWSLDALIENGRVNRLDLTSWSAGACLFAHRRAGFATVRLGAGLRAGVLQVSAGPSVATWGWPLGVLSLTLRGGPMVVDLTGEMGYGVLPIRGGSNPALWATWLNGQLGVGLVL